MLGLAGLVIAGVAVSAEAPPVSSPRFESRIDPAVVHARDHLARVLDDAEAKARLAERDMEPMRSDCHSRRRQLERVKAQLEEIKRRKRELQERIRRERKIASFVVTHEVPGGLRDAISELVAR